MTLLLDSSQSKNLSLVTYILATVLTQPAFTCSKLTIETLEQCVKYVQS